MIMATGNHVSTYIPIYPHIIMYLNMVWIPTYSPALLAMHILCGNSFGGHS